MNSKTMSALAESHRLKIIELLAKQPCSVNEVARALNLRQPQTSKHLQVLCEAGLVTVQPQAQRRVYSIKPEALAELQSWLKELEAHWQRQLDKLGRYLQQPNERKSDGT